MEVTPGAEIQDDRFNLFKVNFSKLSLVALIFVLQSAPYHCSREKIKVKITTFFPNLQLPGDSHMCWLLFTLLLQACEFIAFYTNNAKQNLFTVCCDLRIVHICRICRSWPQVQRLLCILLLSLAKLEIFIFLVLKEGMLFILWHGSHWWLIAHS